MRSQSIRVSIVALAFLCGIAVFAAVAPPVAAQDDEQQVNATVEYHLEPDEPDKVRIEITYEGLEDVDSLNLQSGSTETEDLEDQIEGLEPDDEGIGTSWNPIDGVDTATMVYHMDAGYLGVGDGEQTYGEDGSWALIEEEEPYTGNAVTVDYTHTTSDGLLSPHEDHVYLKDDLTVATAETETAGVTVIGTPEEMTDSPQAVADALADVTDEIDYGATDEHVTAYAVPTIGGAPSFAATGGSFQVAEADISIHDTGSLWFHEQVHTADGTDRNSATGDYDWFHEGYANYGAVLYGTQAGYQSFDQYREYLETWSGDRVVLTEANKTDQASYFQGARALAALDYEIRVATDGDATIEDVIGELHGEQDRTHEDFVDSVANVANEDVADKADTWLTTTEPIFEDGLWEYEEHEAVFGTAPNFDTSGVTATVSDVETERTLELDENEFEEWVAVREDQTLTIEVTVENTGSVAGTTTFSIDSFELPFEEQTVTTIESGASDTLTWTYQVDAADSGSFSIDDLGTLYIDGAPADTVVVDGHPAGDELADPILLADGRDVTVGAGITPGTLQGDVTVEALDGDTVAEEFVPIGSRTTTIDGDQFDRSTTYAVTFDYLGEERTRYVSTLDPVNGTVPVDLNGDGLHRDFDGDGSVTHDDVTHLYDALEDDVIQDHPAAYDFDGDGTVDESDVIELSRDV